MARTYAVVYENTTVSAAQDLFAYLPAANHACVLQQITLTARPTSGTTTEMLRVKLIRGHTVAGSGGSTTTPKPLDPGTTIAAYGTARVNDTTIASSGTTSDLHAETFNNGIGFLYKPDYQAATNPVWANAEYLVLRLMAAPLVAQAVSITVVFDETN